MVHVVATENVKTGSKLCPKPIALLNWTICISKGVYLTKLTMVSFNVHSPQRKYCITGIFPGTFISRKLMILTFSRF